jgi:hypothetical protein
LSSVVPASNVTSVGTATLELTFQKLGNPPDILPPRVNAIICRVADGVGSGVACGVTLGVGVNVLDGVLVGAGVFDGVTVTEGVLVTVGVMVGVGVGVGVMLGSGKHNIYELLFTFGLLGMGVYGDVGDIALVYPAGQSVASIPRVPGGPVIAVNACGA